MARWRPSSTSHPPAERNLEESARSPANGAELRLDGPCMRAAVAVVDRAAEGVLAVVDEIRAAGRTAEGFVCDVSDAASITELVDSVVTKLGPVDILVNNAGVSMPAPIDSDGWQDAWDATFA